MCMRERERSETTEMLHKNKNEGHIEEIISEGRERRRECVCVNEREE